MAQRDRASELRRAGSPGRGGEVGAVMGPVAGTLTVPGRVREVRGARSFVGQVLAGRPCRELAVLLTSEIVTNSVLHSRSGDGGKVTIVLIDLGSVVRVEVVDDGSDDLPRAAPGEAGLADRGRGLQIVGHVALRWGHHRDDHGLTTWFEICDKPDASGG